MRLPPQRNGRRKRKMKQLGNLAMVCARHPEVLMQLSNGIVSVRFGTGPNRETVSAKWEDDAAISGIIQELNFGKGAKQRKEAA